MYITDSLVCISMIELIQKVKVNWLENGNTEKSEGAYACMMQGYFSLSHINLIQSTPNLTVTQKCASIVFNCTCAHLGWCERTQIMGEIGAT